MNVSVIKVRALIQINWLPILRGMFGYSVYDNTEVYLRQTAYFDFVNQLLANETQNKTR